MNPPDEPNDFARLLRVVDANLNRAREALRVLEDVFRLGLDDARTSAKIKQLRHGLLEYEKALGVEAPDLAASRDPERDVGREAPGAGYRNVEELATANARRLEEALRVLEEYGRLLGKGGSIASRTRFEAYALEKSAVPGSGRLFRLEEARLCFILNAGSKSREKLELCRSALRGGADIIQLRAFRGPDSQLLDFCRELIAPCAEAGALFIVNDRADAAFASGADGVHLGRGDMPVEKARAVLGRGRLIGLSAHSEEEAAAVEGADYLGVGTVFPSGTKPERPVIGPQAAAALIAASPVPAFAVGGVNLDNVGELTALGVFRAAVSGAIAEADDPENAARALKESLLSSSC